MTTHLPSNLSETQTINPAHEIIDAQTTDCCIVGGGPAGVVLALLLARQGIPVMLLEVHKDFDRDFRGDTIHPSVMEIMEELGLAERLLQIPHSKLYQLNIQTEQESLQLVDFTDLKTHYPYITVMPQVRFLEFIINEARQYPNFHLVTGANVQELIQENGVIQGVRYRGQGGWHEIRAHLVVGADGRHSRLRQLANFEPPVGTSPPMDVLWFRLPRKSEEPVGLMGRFGRGHIVAMLDRGEQWQLGYVIPKGGYQELRTAGLEALRKSILGVVPELEDRIHLLQDWSQIAFLSVESNRLKRWYRLGLLLIGDAAHVMSPVAGVGINYAIADAVVAANILSEPLKNKGVELHHLSLVQRRRELPTRIIQTFQSLIQQQIFVRALKSEQQFQPPAFVRLPLVRNILARLIGFGFSPAHVQI